MKKIIVLITAVFLVISLGAYSQTNEKTAGKTKTEQAKKKSVIKGTKTIHTIASAGVKKSESSATKSSKAGTKTKSASESGKVPKSSKSTTTADSGKKTSVKEKGVKSETSGNVSTEKMTKVKPEKEVKSLTGSNGMGTDKPGANDKILSGKKGPEGQSVYLGPRGGEYYINKNGNRTYLTPDKK